MGTFFSSISDQQLSVDLVHDSDEVIIFRLIDLHECKSILEWFYYLNHPPVVSKFSSDVGQGYFRFRELARCNS